MVQLVGKYLHERNENMDEYFKAIGVPYIARKMMAATSPTLDVKNENEEWTLTTSTMLRTVVVKFKLGEEYNESMPGGDMKSTTVLEGDNKLKTTSVGPNNTKLTRTYEFNDDGCILTFTHDETGVCGKRYFKRG